MGFACAPQVLRIAAHLAFYGFWAFDLLDLRVEVGITVSGGSKGGMKVGGLKDPQYILTLLYWGSFPIPHLPSSYLLGTLTVGLRVQETGV